jgi:hypothetical protein
LHTKKAKSKTSTKTQRDYTFNEARTVAAKHLSTLASFMEDLNDRMPDKVPLDWAITLRTIENKVNQTSSPCLSEYDIRQIWDLAQQLIHANPDTTTQLSQFWNLYDDLFGILRANPNVSGYAPQWKIDELRPKIENADSLAERLVSEGGNKPSFALSIALLLAHVIRTESIEYPIWIQLTDIIQKYKLQNYDAALICSVKYKVAKYNKRIKQDEWRSDVRAIRDAIAHAHFSISKVGNEDMIEFNNNEEGYRFQERFTITVFHRFFDSHTLLLKFQMLLLIIIELLPILTTHFLKNDHL